MKLKIFEEDEEEEISISLKQEGDCIWIKALNKAKGMEDTILILRQDGTVYRKPHIREELGFKAGVSGKIELSEED